MSRVFHGANSAASTLSRVGLDPAGGTDPASAAIAWSAWDSQEAQYTSVWRLIETPTVAASSGFVTVFLDFVQTENAGWHINCFDDAAVTAL
jgi:hypothetical protein